MNYFRGQTLSESCNNALTFEFVDEVLKCDHYNVTIQMKATEQCFPVMLFIMRYKVVVTFESVDEILV